MRPRGQTPRMRQPPRWSTPGYRSFNEAAGADPADAAWVKRELPDTPVLQ